MPTQSGVKVEHREIDDGKKPEKDVAKTPKTNGEHSDVKKFPAGDHDDDFRLSLGAAAPKRKKSPANLLDPSPNKKTKRDKTKVKTERIVSSDENDDFATVSPKPSTAGKNRRRDETGGRKSDTKKPGSSVGKAKKTKADESKTEVWKWWEEMPHPEGIYWLTLEHNGPYFAPPYERLPISVKFYYGGKPVSLCVESEEVATFYAKMLDHDYTTKDVFNNNFFNDWRKVMNAKESALIVDLKQCDFKEMHNYFKEQNEIKKGMSKEDKEVVKKKNAEIADKYGVCMVDGHEQKVGNFKIEPPGLFRGRGNHPKQGKLKLRVQPEDVTVNISRDAPVPSPPEGHSWKSVVHDNKVTWLAQWIENISNSYKYVMLNPTTKIKGVKDMEKFDVARGLHNCIETIRDNYHKDMTSNEMKVRQRAVALYFIDKLALRAGHEKEDGESADTVGCCSLRVEHIKLKKDFENKKYLVEFDFLGKDSVRYANTVVVEKRVYKNLKLFMKNKTGEDDMFDRLNTNMLNKYLGELMDGLTAKVFRTYNASTTLQEQLDKLTDSKASAADLLLSYNRANRAVAILCNHQRTVPKTFNKTMENLTEKLKKKKKETKECLAEIKQLKKDKSAESKLLSKKAKLKRLKDQLHKLKISVTDKEENKEIALGTSKLNYLDPRISVAWCRRYNVPMEKIYNKTQREKFQWAIDMTDGDFVF